MKSVFRVPAALYANFFTTLVCRSAATSLTFLMRTLAHGLLLGSTVAARTYAVGPSPHASRHARPPESRYAGKTLSNA